MMQSICFGNVRWTVFHVSNVTHTRRFESEYYAGAGSNPPLLFLSINIFINAVRNSVNFIVCAGFNSDATLPCAIFSRANNVSQHIKVKSEHIIKWRIALFMYSLEKEQYFAI